MNFAYLDPRSLLESVLVAPPEPITPVPCELDHTWKSFEKDLSNFKTKFAQSRRDLSQKSSILAEKKEEINILNMMLDNVSSQKLKDSLVDMIGDYEVESGLSALKQECGEIAGRVEAMKKVLVDTGAERYGKFTCFVCMDRLVDLFVDPCGHVICERCWVSTRDKTVCPGCRTPTQAAKKIFTL